ncbi:unnamed protein product [Clonostachys chloroleuca]|uniref:Carboxymuconolactone decarboxylase-like domain-containing protein n=1 Tax=Clonostachys chloroleuca TaxID=1926264 RepID=A0AA35PX37_9HYPO|nr:unnamed protein product [Clonostachys chloroleuca]
MAKDFFGEEILADIRSQSVMTPSPKLNLLRTTRGYKLTAVSFPQREDLPSKIASEYVNETCFASYARPHLEFRERSLLNIAMLIALNRSNELKLHIRAALYNGLSREQVCEACRHAMVYCGVPAGRTALLVASDVFTELDAKKSS